MNRIASLVSGIVFGIGLTISEMINPAKVLGFLDLFGNWDPSLMFVMIGALLVSSPMFHLIKKREKPIFAENFNFSNNKVIDSKLVIGSALFGAGWGLGGLCPGPCNFFNCTFKYLFNYICNFDVCRFLFSKNFKIYLIQKNLYFL
jgi:uncharacterized membrane protein YedE/YeeE